MKIIAAKVEVEDSEDVFSDVPFGIPEEPTPAGGGSGASCIFSPKIWNEKMERSFYATATISIRYIRKT
jgi:hypothetical protein